MQELNGAINLPRLGVKPEPQPTCTLGGLTRARRGEIKMPPRGPAGQAPGPAWASCSPSSSRERPVHGSLVRVSVPSRHGCALPAARSSRSCYPSEPGSRRSPAVAPSPASFPVTCGHTRCLEPAASGNCADRGREACARRAPLGRRLAQAGRSTRGGPRPPARARVPRLTLPSGHILSRTWRPAPPPTPRPLASCTPRAR